MILWPKKFDRVVKIDFCVPGWTFWRKMLIEIKTIFIDSKTPEKYFELPGRHFRWHCQNCNLPFRRNVLGKCKNFFRNTVYFGFLGVLAKIFQSSGKIFSVGLSKLDSGFPEERFEVNHFSWKNFLIFFGRSAKDFGRIFKTAFFMSRGSFWEEIL